MGGLIGAFMAILDIQITNASLKDIQGALSATLSESSWISTSYLVAEMIAIPLSGWLSRGLSVRRYLLWTTGAFIVASVLCSFSWNLTSMIVFRALQGFTGGALIPMAFSLIVSLLPLHKRATGMALFGLCATFAPAIGPTLGGWLTEQLSWHYIFYLNVPPGLLVMAMLAHGLDRKPVDWEVIKRVDLVGILTMAVGLGLLEVVLEEGNREDWFGSSFIVRLTVISVVALVFFVISQLLRRHPLVNLRLLHSPRFALACFAYLVLGMALMGGALLWRLGRAGWVKGAALLALVIPILLHTQTEYPFYHAIALWWALLLLIHVLDAEVEEGGTAGHANWREYVYRPWLLLRFLAIGIPLIVVPFMLTALHTAWVVTKYERGGYKQPALLLDIVNPMAWLTRVEFDVNAVRLMVGLQSNNHGELEAYLDWGLAFVRHTPRANIYANMVIALNALGRTEEADRLRTQALMLYPGEPLLTASAAKSVAATLEPKPSS